MVQINTVHSNKKKRNVLSRSTLMAQVLTLRQNNKILAKAVAQKALKICELEDKSLSYENLKLEGRESISSFHEYLSDLEEVIQKAVLQLTELVKRFSAILSTTRVEKQKVEYLSNLIEDESSCPKQYGLRGRTVTSEVPHSKDHEQNTHRSSFKRVHPMNLRKSVCVLEPLKERNDASFEIISSSEDEIVKQKPSISSIKSEEMDIKSEKYDEQDVGNNSLQEFDSISRSSYCDNLKRESAILPSPGLKTVIKREVLNSKGTSKSESVASFKSSFNITKRSRDTVLTITSPRKLRPRKSLNYADMLNFRPQSTESPNDRSKTTEVEEKENRGKPGIKKSQKNVINKKSPRKRSTTPLCQQQTKLELLDPYCNPREPQSKCLDESSKKKCLKETFFRLHDATRPTKKHYSKIPVNIKKSPDKTVSENDVTQDLSKSSHIFNTQIETEVRSKTRTFHERISDGDIECQSSVRLPQIGVEESYYIKQEMITPE